MWVRFQNGRRKNREGVFEHEIQREAPLEGETNNDMDKSSYEIYCTVLAVLVGNNRLSHSVSTLFICFRIHRRYYTTVELERSNSRLSNRRLSNPRTVDSRSLELSYSLTLLFLLSFTPFPS
jgi:hypothetical protein